MSKESREAYIGKLEAKLREWSAEIDKLKATAERSEVKIREEYHKRIEDLRARREDIKKRIRKLKEAGEETWEELKSGTEKAWREMKAAIDKAASKFK
ncbi:MAG: coiled coil domain-containing protein [Nitrospirae bacterium]|nr:coiled coil domain-containing protein [Nitrospirota bacterium]